MSGISLTTRTGPRSYTPASGTSVKGGQLVAAGTGGRIVIAGSGSVKVLGVALTDAVAPESVTSAVVGDPPTLAAVPQPTSTAVAYGGVEAHVTYTADAAFGDRLVAGANGAVTALTAVPADARLVVGVCTEPGGVTISKNPVGLARI